ncbi:ABC transporter ATP-binding protein [Paenochrobactrum pullorum]|uniref:ABC transporter ATP-binding protein n=1 Tax=Paenochrobactrum pullorum TaxID=1324351 RepID=UPI0035BBE842
MLLTPPHIVIEALSHAFSDKKTRAGNAMPVLQDINLSVRRGETIVFLGPSGCGKTTLLRLIAGLIKPDQGSILVNGAAPQAGVGSAMMFQSFRLLPWKTVRENIAFALPHLKVGERIAPVDKALAQVGLTRFADYYPAQLSGGMCQRVALARALVVEPDLLLMDEPFASLDAQSRELMQAETLRLTEKQVATGFDASNPAKATLLFVTHSVDEALIMGDRIVLMAPRPGRIHEVIEVPFARPRFMNDPRDAPDFIQLRQHLWAALREMVLADPQSDFYGRGNEGIASW